ncbi:MAG TPA: non-canonical purine NTP pyrophosphatase [Thermoplasmata archaeon]|nr:non-canonical purine NTP pyrophosphatase [Thermoplasmata archaeon]
MDVRFVTSNDGKFREVRRLLAPFGLRAVRVRRVMPEPQTDRLETVVRAKLGSLPPSPEPTVVEDSGLFIHGLNGFPGVYSAHFYRVWGFDPILELLRRRDRSATFRTVAGLRVGTRVRLFAGDCPGEVVDRPRGRGGFGFDPIFRPRGSRQTYAEMSASEKDLYSHRAAAFTRLARSLVRARAGRRPRNRGVLDPKTKGTRRMAR